MDLSSRALVARISEPLPHGRISCDVVRSVERLRGSAMYVPTRLTYARKVVRQVAGSASMMSIKDVHKRCIRLALLPRAVK